MLKYTENCLSVAESLAAAARLIIAEVPTNVTAARTTMIVMVTNNSTRVKPKRDDFINLSLEIILILD
jgi:hypothetical protein